MKRLLIMMAVFWQVMNVSAYCETGNRTASGVWPQVGMAAVDKINGEWVKFGTIIKIKGYGTLKVTDRFGDGRNNCVDIYMDSYNKCIEFGRQNREAEVITP